MDFASAIALVQATMAAITLVILLISSYKITKVEHLTNSMKDELVQEVRLSAFAAGQKQQQQDTDVH